MRRRDLLLTLWLLGLCVVVFLGPAAGGSAPQPPGPPPDLIDDPTADGDIRALWERFRQALAAQDVEAAVDCFIPPEQEAHRTLFQQAPQHLPALAQSVAVIEVVYVQGDVAKYRLRRVRVVQGQPREITHYIYFFKMPDGSWLIDSF